MNQINKSLFQSLNHSKTKEYKELYTSSSECLIIDDNSSDTDQDTNLFKNISSIQSNDNIIDDFNNISENKAIVIKKDTCDKSTNTDIYLDIKINNKEINYYNIIDSEEEKCSCKKIIKSFFTFFLCCCYRK
jgi:hypothetical protein